MEDAQLPLPLEITRIDEELNKQLLKDFTGERTGFLRVGPEGYFLPSKYAIEADNLYNFQPRPDDTWVVTFPRSGTTLTQELVWLIANNLDFETAKKIPQTVRFPYFDFSLLLHDETMEELIKKNASDPEKGMFVEYLSTPGYQILEQMTTPRFIKTHLPFSLLPKTLLQVGCKVIYVARNPKDVAVSFYHLSRLLSILGYRGNFSKFWDYFERNLIPWTPYWSHVNEGWKLKSHPNVLFLFYEEMNKDIQTTINQVAEFLLGRTLSTEDTDRLASYLDITNFRQNPAVNYKPWRKSGVLVEGEESFIRKGKTGGWVEEFTPELTRRADKWIHDNLRNTGLRFPGISDA